jgi:hypothetical protein
MYSFSIAHVRVVVHVPRCLRCSRQSCGHYYALSRITLLSQMRYCCLRCILTAAAFDAYTPPVCYQYSIL